MPESKVIARWESRSGKHWVELLHDGVAATYRAPDQGGCLGKCSEYDALVIMQARVDLGLFQPDNNKTPMRLLA